MYGQLHLHSNYYQQFITYNEPLLLPHSNILGCRRWTLGGQHSFGIGCHFHCQIMAVSLHYFLWSHSNPCGNHSKPMWWCHLACRGAANIWQWNQWRPGEILIRELSITPVGYFTGAIHHSRAVSHSNYFAWRKWYFKGTGMIFPRLALL
jgi:hypothetical protein